MAVSGGDGAQLPRQDYEIVCHQIAVLKVGIERLQKGLEGLESDLADGIDILGACFPSDIGWIPPKER